jgi:predicted glycogen debranching enzyme
LKPEVRKNERSPRNADRCAFDGVVQSQPTFMWLMIMEIERNKVKRKESGSFDTCGTDAALRLEWLEADGLGGFASGTVSGIRTRRYHAMLLAATTPPAGRMVLVNGFDAWVETGEGTFALTSQLYAPDVVHPDGTSRLVDFVSEPWPRWIWRINDAITIEHQVFAVHKEPVVALAWRIRDAGTSRPDSERTGGDVPALCNLCVRLFLSGRDFHSTHHENGAFRFDATQTSEGVKWSPYEGVPEIIARHNGSYSHEPCWYRNFLYAEEQARGLDCMEDCASPGVLRWSIAKGDAVLLLCTGESRRLTVGNVGTIPLYESLAASERSRREALPTPLHRAADAYLVQRGTGRTIIAGYPWFGDWGRDTFIALRGLCLAAGRLDEARAILVEWADAVSEGMLPNRFPDQGETPEFNSVDASLWYVIAADEYLHSPHATSADEAKLTGAIEKILAGYSAGTRYGIHVDDDALLACGEPGVQLTWMDAKVGDWVVTPRIGKPVEVQALWFNALQIGAKGSTRWKSLLERGLDSFRRRFLNGDSLFDVIDCNHEHGKNDPSIRPNQIFAVGGLPYALLQGDRARRVVEQVEEQLLTPLGLRSLARGEPGYTARYEGGVLQRDGSYHQGTVWPWLIGPFVEAWLRVRSGTPEAKAAARERFLVPLHDHMGLAGLGHISEIADAEPPHTPRGCPFQAWSVGELLRVEALLDERCADSPAGKAPIGPRK